MGFFEGVLYFGWRGQNIVHLNHTTLSDVNFCKDHSDKAEVPDPLAVK